MKKSKAQSFRIGIAGSGLLGRLLAYHLIQAGYRVSLFDKGDQEGKDSCGFIAAGMLSPYSELEKAELPIYEMGLHAFSYWKEFAQNCKKPGLFQESGSLLVSHERDAAELERFLNIIRSRLKIPLDFLTTEALSALEPQLPRSMRSIFLPREASVDSRLVFKVLGQYVAQHAEHWFLHTEVHKVVPFSIESTQGTFSFDWVFDCRGLGAASQITGLRGVRGELLWLWAPGVQFSRPIRIMHPRHRLYLLPRGNNQFILGASEIESADNSPISVRSALELLTAVYSVHPGFAEARIIESCVGCRPAFFNNLPKIVSEAGYMAINGLYRHGYLLAPAIVQDAVALFSGNKEAILYPEYIKSA